MKRLSLSTPKILTVIPLLFALTACGSSGTPPTISDLTLTPTEASVGKSNALTGKLTIADPDGDAAEIEIEIKLPSGQSQALPATALQGVAEQTLVSAQIALAFAPPTAGTYEITIHCNDEAGNASNTLTATVEAK